MLYELVNPSDPVTFETPDFKVAALLTLYLGKGRFSAETQEEGAPNVPMFFFGGAEKWWQETFGETLDDSVSPLREPLAKALRTLCVGKASHRALFDSALAAIDDPAKRDAFVADWNDRQRSSMNDIMGYAHKLAGQLERQLEAERTEALEAPPPPAVATA
jgi:hypothetical protein